jgi:hypothetical protein
LKYLSGLVIYVVDEEIKMLPAGYFFVKSKKRKDGEKYF